MEKELSLWNLTRKSSPMSYVAFDFACHTQLDYVFTLQVHPYIKLTFLYPQYTHGKVGSYHRFYWW